MVGTSEYLKYPVDIERYYDGLNMMFIVSFIFDYIVDIVGMCWTCCLDVQNIISNDEK